MASLMREQPGKPPRLSLEFRNAMELLSNGKKYMCSFDEYMHHLDVALAEWRKFREEEKLWRG